MKGQPEQPFSGFRVNCESVPRLPASAVRCMVDDQRRIPYFLIWRWMDEEPIREAVRLSVSVSSLNCVYVQRKHGPYQPTKIAWRQLPRNGGSAMLLVCLECGAQRRHLYGWRVQLSRVSRSRWVCRECAGLRYRSEGTYLPRHLRVFGGYPRTPPWDPWILADS
jgi:hypothetical protein